MSETEENFYRTSIKALILNEEGKFLLGLEPNGKWEMPGGGLDHGEMPHACIEREVMEETGLTVTHIDTQPCYFVTAEYENRWKSNVYYVTTVKDYNLTPTDECVELRFFSAEEANNVELFPIIAEFVKVFDPKNHTL